MSSTAALVDAARNETAGGKETLSIAASVAAHRAAGADHVILAVHIIGLWGDGSRTRVAGWHRRP